MSVDTPLIKFIQADVGPDVAPSIDGHSVVTGGVHQKDLAWVTLELENHGDVIVLGPRDLPGEESAEVPAPE